MQVVQVVQRQEVRLHADGSLSGRRAVDYTQGQVGAQSINTTHSATIIDAVFLSTHSSSDYRSHDDDVVLSSPDEIR